MEEHGANEVVEGAAVSSGRAERQITHTEDLDALLEEEIPDAPPLPPRRRNNGQVKSPEFLAVP